MTDGCVQFNKNSWHYKATKFVFERRLVDYADRPRPINLCPYMRAVVFATALIPFIFMWRKLPYRVQEFGWLVQVECIFMFLVLAVSYGMNIADESAGNDKFPPFNDLVMYGFLGGNLVGIVGGALVFGVISLTEYIKGRPRKEHKTRGLVKTYMASKHDKICPCVEFVDND